MRQGFEEDFFILEAGEMEVTREGEDFYLVNRRSREGWPIGRRRQLKQFEQSLRDLLEEVIGWRQSTAPSAPLIPDDPPTDPVERLRRAWGAR